MRILVGRRHQRLGRLDQRVGPQARAILQHQLEAARAAQALHRRRRDGQHIGVLDHRQTLAQVGQHGLGGHARQRVVVERGQAREHRARVRGDRQRGRVEPDEGRGMFDAARGQRDVGDLAHHLLGALERRARRQLDHGDQVALVLLGDEAGGRARELDARHCDQRDVDRQHHGQAAHQAARDVAVAERDPFEAAIEARETGIEEARDASATASLVAVVRLEQHRAQRRAQRQRDEAGDHRRGRDGHRELPEEQARDAAQEGRGHEHRAQRQRDRQQRAAHLVHGAVRRLDGRHAGAHVALDVLHHHDRVVDHDPHRQHQPEQREVVQRDAEGGQHDEGAQQRDRDRHHRNDGGAPVSAGTRTPRPPPAGSPRRWW